MDVLQELNKFYKNFNGEKGYIGQTEGKRLIPFFAVRHSFFPTVIVTYSIHAREYITTYLALRQISDFYKNGKIGTVYFIPAVNLDGIDICLKKDSLYKANGRQVDLNVNFDARWGKGIHNVKVKSSENYVGDFPFSESESRALRDFTVRVRPDFTISYHSKGEEIYWEFFQDKDREFRDLYIAKKISDCTGYPLIRTMGSVGGYKDWCIDKLKIPSVTIEVGEDCLSHPIGKQHLEEIYQKNKDVINTALIAVTEIQCKKSL